MIYRGELVAIGGLAGIYGKLLLSGVDEVVTASTADNISQLASGQDFHIGQIVKDECVRQLSERNDIQLVAQGPAEAELSVEIRTYGLQDKLGDRLIPMLTLALEIRDTSGNVVERGRIKYKHVAAGRAKAPIYSLEEFAEDPERFRTMWEAVVTYSVSRLLDRTLERQERFE